MLIILLATLLISSCFGDINAEPTPTLSRKLPISELDHYVNTNEGTAILVNEFNAIEGGQRRPWTVAALPENLRKNRRDNLLAFDETRVILEILPDVPNSDYINANYINGQNRIKEYVATQGPLPSTVNDFWRMIWQLNATKIIMMANLTENGQLKYWPETFDVYGDIIVTKISQHEIPKLPHIVRTFSLRKGDENRPRSVRHFHYTGWHDLGVPNDSLSVISFVIQVREYRPDCKVPIVVHCSAGVGRTGTVILTDSMLQKAIAEGEVDFPKRLDEMRLQRVNVVEKEVQYVFAHEAINDYFRSNDTEKYLRNVQEEYKKIDTEPYSDAS